MTRACVVLAVATTLGLLLPHAHAHECDTPSPQEPRVRSEGADIAKEKFSGRQYPCALQWVKLAVGALASVPGREGVDARFALREMALALSTDPSHPLDQRLALLQAATEPAAGAAARPVQELQADLALQLSAARAMQSRRETSGWLAALIAAIRLDQQLPDAERRMAIALFTSHLQSTEVRDHVDQLAVLAEQARGDPRMEQLRSALVALVYYNIPAWRREDTPQATAERCQQLLRLTQALDDAKACRDCPPGWQWKPILEVGSAYARLGRQDDANRQLQQAVEIVRSIENDNARLGQYRFLLPRLLALRYNRETVLNLVDEITRTMEASETPLAREMRDTLPRLLTQWNVEPRSPAGPSR